MYHITCTCIFYVFLGATLLSTFLKRTHSGWLLVPKYTLEHELDFVCPGVLYLSWCVLSVLVCSVCPGVLCISWCVLSVLVCSVCPGVLYLSWCVLSGSGGCGYGTGGVLSGLGSQIWLKVHIYFPIVYIYFFGHSQNSVTI